ncbi:hypothetical protein CR513_21858, partial [Mucuna pruriens]
ILHFQCIKLVYCLLEQLKTWKLEKGAVKFLETLGQLQGPPIFSEFVPDELQNLVQNLGVPALDNKANVYQEHSAEDLSHMPNPEPVDMVSSEVVERVKFVCERKSKERSCRNVKTLTAEITAQSKEACGVLIETEYEPEAVDIDADDPNELAVAEYIDDIYRFFKQTEVPNILISNAFHCYFFISLMQFRMQEERQYRVSDYMNSQHGINEMMRSIMVDWLVETHMRFKLMPETLYLTVNLIDRYLSSTFVPKEEIQLLGISSMLIACKYEETKPIRVKDLISISDNAYSKNQILSMEKAILEKLKWHLTVPTPYVFLIRLLKLSDERDQQMENMVFFLAELSLVHYKTAISFLPSMRAAAAIYAARCTLNRRPFWNQILKHKAGYTAQELRDCAKLLVRLHSNAPGSVVKTVYKKFCSLEKGGVALLSPPQHIEKHL